ncbi:pogo transposable element, putative [Talaromyces stipitatus ATCC 10500]|uniref:Pogo transposable element, putative n=1 Tax=Talaromyces stipitatus (strain ATCC 10500 / CBS 375.48 / QM 6759 / NRRL 1006) TaxID=441959 RepID=B8MN67_TALSN|nr:pogo transposable element, putative [Talaromyces stipitatus ATCC 10500]EED14516.1 pogo transposable element, putative [Talaromyces stipitatus ATCC 10500]
MPPIRNKNSKNSAEQEGRILLAISDVKNGKLRSARQAAEIYNVSRSTLQNRLNGMAYRAETRANSHKLSKSEEESLVKWVGEKWVYNLIRRRPEIESKISRKYNYERAKCEDPKIIQEYFDRVREVVSEHGILQEDIYNFDETGFAMGLCATAKPGNREWVTAIEAVNSIGWALPSYIIFKAKKYTRLGWFEDLPDDWKINISDNGWTTDKIGLEWLKTHFIPLTDGRTLGKYRMLILDGHGSHLTPEFDRTCTENNIIPVCMPPYSSHLLQPLDVGCFAVLKRHYGQLVEQRMRLGFNHIDKIDFLTAFPKARTMAYKAQTVRNSFIATGLVPFNPDRVYQQLTVRLKTPTPPPSRSSDTQSSCLQTPQNLRQFKRQMTTTKKRISRHTRSSSEAIGEVFTRASKAYEMSINKLTIAQKELHDLRAAHEKEKQKRRRSKQQISHEQGITREEAQALVQGQIEVSQAVTTAPAEPELPVSHPPVRRQFRCSDCGVAGHKITGRPNRIST